MKTEPNEPINSTLHAKSDTIDNMRENGYLGGLTKREYFAAMAMQGLVANARVAENMGTMKGVELENKHHIVAKMAITVADALIEQLNATEK